MKTERPWGLYEVLLDEQSYKVKRIVVSPLARISYQSHKKRSEVWVVTGGAGIVTIDDVESEVGYNSIICIPANSKHRIKNTSQDKDLVFIEVQTGESFLEEDIIRYHDDFDRPVEG